jgi:hypothetical protein
MGLIYLLHVTILKILYFLANHTGTDEWQCRYIRDKCSYVCRTKQGRKTRALWGISWYHRVYNVTAEVSRKPRTL